MCAEPFGRAMQKCRGRRAFSATVERLSRASRKDSRCPAEYGLPAGTSLRKLRSVPQATPEVTYEASFALIHGGCRAFTRAHTRNGAKRPKSKSTGNSAPAEWSEFPRRKALDHRPKYG